MKDNTIHVTHDGHTYAFHEVKNIIGAMGIWSIYEGQTEVGDLERVGSKFVVNSHISREKHTIDITLVRRQDDALVWAASHIRPEQVDESRHGLK